MRRCLPIALTVLVLAVPARAAAARSPSGPTPPVSHDGRWITDDRGRVAIFHGFNMVYKLPPYEPSATGFGRDDAKFLRRNGFNAVRLGIIYKGLEPQPANYGHNYDAAYLDSIAKTQRDLAKSGVYSLLDFHQDMYNERFQGEGWPDWAVQDDGLSNPQNGFLANYLTNPALNRAFDHFWANDSTTGGQGLQDAYSQAWSHVAGAFADQRYVLGYDLLNEPWPGSVHPTCLNPSGCPAFDEDTLTPFSKRTIGSIRQTDAKTLAFYEPNVTFDFGAATSHGATGDPRAGMSFHAYCLPVAFGGPGSGPGCEPFEDLVFQNADSQSEKTGDALLLTEFGSTDDLAELERIARLADQHMTGWLEWTYCGLGGCGDPSGSTPPEVEGLVIDPGRPPEGDNVKLDKLRTLARPYPQAIAGTPMSWSFDPDTLAFKLEYSTGAPGEGRLPRRVKTVVSLPELQYPDGYALDVHGARPTSKRNARLLKLKRKRGARKVSVAVDPR